MKNRNQSITRRHFLKETAGGAGILAVGSGSFAASMGLARGASVGKDPNPFAYDVERLRKTDPKLIHYEQVGQFPSPKPDPRRIAAGPDNRIYIAAADSVCVLDQAGAKTIVTRDDDLLTLGKPFGIQIITPRELLLKLSKPF